MDDERKRNTTTPLEREVLQRLLELEHRVRDLEDRDEEREKELERKREQLAEARAMGDEYPPTLKAHRLRLRKRFEDAELRYLGSRFRNGALMIFERPDGEEVRVLTYVVNKRNRFGVCSFTVGHLNDPGIDWVTFIAWPLRSTFLKRMSEITTRFSTEDRDQIPSQVNITFREGSPDDDRFGYRVWELVEGPLER